jgi:hypothetical protein
LSAAARVELVDPAAFEPLTTTPWARARVQGAVRKIAEDAAAACGPDRLWPTGAADLRGSFRVTPPLTNVYNGAAGVLWALAALRRGGHAETALDLGAAAGRAYELWGAAADYELQQGWPGRGHSGLLLSRTGIALVGYQLSPSAALADDVYECVRDNMASTADELMWGTPGTMVAALTMLDWTSDRRWADVWRSSAERLLGRREPGGLWTHPTAGGDRPLLGLLHGSCGAVHALLQGRHLLEDRQVEELLGSARAVLAGNAVAHRGLANWPVAAGEPLASRSGEIRVQWCHGASGVVCAASAYLDEELIAAGAELVWRAGPLRKGAGLCHGTAGNGYALLKTFERTGDERWLERARRFAVHALQQVERTPGHYSLWTGDVGAALFAADCLEGRATLPTVDRWAR